MSCRQICRREGHFLFSSCEEAYGTEQMLCTCHLLLVSKHPKQRSTTSGCGHKHVTGDELACQAAPLFRKMDVKTCAGLLLYTIIKASVPGTVNSSAAPSVACHGGGPQSAD